MHNIKNKTLFFLLERTILVQNELMAIGELMQKLNSINGFNSEVQLDGELINRLEVGFEMVDNLIRDLSGEYVDVEAIQKARYKLQQLNLLKSELKLEIRRQEQELAQLKLKGEQQLQRIVTHDMKQMEAQQLQQKHHSLLEQQEHQRRMQEQEADKKLSKYGKLSEELLLMNKQYNELLFQLAQQPTKSNSHQLSTIEIDLAKLRAQIEFCQQEMNEVRKSIEQMPIVYASPIYRERVEVLFRQRPVFITFNSNLFSPQNNGGRKKDDEDNSVSSVKGAPILTLYDDN